MNLMLLVAVGTIHDNSHTKENQIDEIGGADLRYSIVW